MKQNKKGKNCAVFCFAEKKNYYFIYYAVIVKQKIYKRSTILLLVCACVCARECVHAQHGCHLPQAYMCTRTDTDAYVCVCVCARARNTVALKHLCQLAKYWVHASEFVTQTFQDMGIFEHLCQLCAVLSIFFLPTCTVLSSAVVETSTMAVCIHVYVCMYIHTHTHVYM